MATIQPAQRVLNYVLPDGENFIDIAADLSRINRRAYRQGMQYAIGKIEFAFLGQPADAVLVQLTAKTAGNTWVVHNAWKKAQAHWLQQQSRARKLIGQSAKPAYEDFKVYLDDAHRTGNIVTAIASDGVAVGSGEWDYSRLVYEADDNAIQEWYMHIIGGDVSTTDKGLILGYQDSRATVQAEDPDLPAEYSSNMYAAMAADLDLVADEVAQNMEDENDEPPYDQDDYPGNDTNADAPWIQSSKIANASIPNGVLGGFIAECGLINLKLDGYTAAGANTAAPGAFVWVTLVPGKYKGVAAVPMGQ